MSMRPPKGTSLERRGILFPVRAQIRKSAVAREIYRRRHNQKADVFLLSFPKAGRTWLRLLISKAIATHFEVQNPELFSLEALASFHRDIPRIRCKHDDDPQWKRPNEIVTRKTEYRDRKVILLVRDLRDLVVSAYFQVSRREGMYDESMQSFVYCGAGSVATLIRFYNVWAENRDIPRNFLLVRYEDVHRAPHQELRRVLDFVGLTTLSTEAIDAAVEFARFENMRRLEASGALDSGRLRPADPTDLESFKTRRGQVGGYVEYLDDNEIRFIEKKIQTELDPFYGYS